MNLQNFLTLGPEERAARAQVPVNQRDIWRME